LSLSNHFSLRRHAVALSTAEALFRDRDSRLFGSEIEQTLKRKRPEFSEVFHGYRSFNELLEDAQRRGRLQLQKDERSGGYIVVVWMMRSDAQP
jgi:predicted N-acyltransferase